MSLLKMLAAHPDAGGIADEPLARCLAETITCAAVCTACADACVAEAEQQLTQCIRLNLDCADICAALSRVGIRQTGNDVSVLGRLLDLCVMACARCAEECERHGSIHEHCAISAQICRKCEAACDEALAILR